MSEETKQDQGVAALQAADAEPVELIIDPNEGYEVKEFAIEWRWKAGHRSFGGNSYSRKNVEATLAKPRDVPVTGRVVERTITTSPWCYADPAHPPTSEASQEA